MPTEFQNNLTQLRNANTPEFQSYVTQQKALSEQLSKYVQESPLGEQLGANEGPQQQQAQPLATMPSPPQPQTAATINTLQPQQLPSMLSGSGFGSLGQQGLGGGVQQNLNLGQVGLTFSPSGQGGQGGQGGSKYTGWNFVDGGPVQQVTQFQPTFSTDPQGIESLQQEPDIPEMESSPTDYNQSLQYVPTTQYNAPAANPMTAGLGSYLKGLEYKAPVANPTGTVDSTNEYIYDPATQTYGARPVVALGGEEDSRSSSVDSGGYGGDSGEKAGGRIHAYAHGGSTPQGIASLGRGPDTMLVHMTPGEVGGLQQLAMAHGGSLTINPQTGLPEAGFLSAMLPMLAAAAAIAFTGGAATPIVAGLEGAAATGGTFMGLAPSIWGAGAGALTGALTNKQSPLMGAVMGGISGYGMGGVGEGLSNLGADQAKSAFAEQASVAGNDAAALALGQGVANNSAAIENLVGQMGPDAAMTPDKYRTFLTDQASSTVEGYTPKALMEQNINTAARNAVANSTFTPPSQSQAALQGLSSLTGKDAGQNWTKFIGQTAKDSATGKATGLGGGIAATMKGVGLAAPLISSALTPNKFVPPPVKPPTYYKTSYNAPQYDPATGLYVNGSYGPGSYYTDPTQYAAQGGAVGYAEGDLIAKPFYGEGVTTGGPGNPGEKPQYSRDIYADAAGEGPYSDTAGEGPYDDKEGRGIHSNTKLDKSTPAKRVLADRKAVAKAKRLKYLLQGDDDTDYAAEGGLMGLHTYAAGGRLLRGPGDGMSDSIPAVIKGARPQRAALADGEFVIPADVVSHLGNGSTEAGSKRLYSMMDKVRRARTGNPKQGRQINPDRFMPA